MAVRQEQEAFHLDLQEDLSPQVYELMAYDAI